MPTPRSPDVRVTQISGIGPRAIFPTPLGWIACTWRDHALCQLTFGHDCPSTAEQSADAAISFAYKRLAPITAQSARDWPSPQLTTDQQQLVHRLQSYSASFREDFCDVVIDHAGLGEFQRRVIACCRAIPPGATLTYGEIAHRVGSPQAARAVGGVMARNRVPLVVPCHRVVGASGRLVGFSAPQGVTMKQRLLDAERSASHGE